ncbi:hypothetical protein [Actinomadura madurae]|uniref:hypothetical protein n=1 Tax=Actinomadura madurae TaxID=1993 RepID=UPI0020D20381|nr:hypothetical protein [Actinomadura madurae]MCQ0010691.1 hypothetical protein [Actinomadura madurae]
MNDVTVTSPPPIRRAMSPYTLVEATTETGPPAGSAAPDDPQAPSPSTEAATAAAVPSTRAR